MHSVVTLALAASAGVEILSLAVGVVGEFFQLPQYLASARVLET